MLKKITTHFLLLTLLVTALIPNFNINANAEDAVTLKKGDKILIGNDYWRVLDPDHANNGEDGIFITLDTFDKKNSSLIVQDYSELMFFPKRGWSTSRYGDSYSNWKTEMNSSEDSYDQGVTQQHFTPQFNAIAQYYTSFLEDYMDDYIIDTTKEADEVRHGDLLDTDYYTNILKPALDKYLSQSTYDFFDQWWRRLDVENNLKNKELIGKVCYLSNGCKISNDKVFPLSVAELSNPKYFSSNDDRKLYNSDGKSVHYWTRNFFFSMVEDVYTGENDLVIEIGSSFVDGVTGDIKDDYTPEVLYYKDPSLATRKVEITRPAMNLSLDILSKLKYLSSSEDKNIYVPDFAEDNNLVEVKAGDTIKMGGIEWIVLDPEHTSIGGNGLFVIAKDYTTKFGEAIYDRIYFSTMVVGNGYRKKFNDIFYNVLSGKYSKYILSTTKASDCTMDDIPPSKKALGLELASNEIRLQKLFAPSIAEINEYIDVIDGASTYTSYQSDEKRGYWTRNAAGIRRQDHNDILERWDYAYYGDGRYYEVEEVNDTSSHYLRPAMNLKYSALLALENDTEDTTDRNRLFKINTVSDIPLQREVVEDEYVDKQLGIQSKVYRLYNRNTSEHLLTSKYNEYISLSNKGWKQEGWTFEAYGSNKAEGLKPVYRLYNPNAKGGDHHYTKSKAEMNKLVKKGWKADYNGKPVFYCKGDKTTYKLYDKNSGRHHYTPKKAEADKLVKLGWKNEGVAWEVSAYNSGKARVY